AKPIDLDDLYARLGRWLPLQPKQASPEPEQDKETESAAVVATPPSAAELSLQRLRELASAEMDLEMDLDRGLRNLGHDSSAYLRLLRQFVQSHGQDGERIRAQLSAGETEQARQLAHALKGVAGNLGLIGLQQAALTLEQALKQQTGELEPLLLTLGQRLGRVYTLVQELPSEILSATAPAPSAAQLQALQAMVQTDDTRAYDAYLQLEAELLQRHGRLAEELGQAIEAYDFPSARRLLGQLLDN
ncbi:MAG: Hpt domain-containing protein, partial [Gammaproteobacteria bacterium]|nr:Hpt domain-containing protein [Gammaproteobacteria bacterium]